MYVSSFNTYINTNTSQATEKQRDTREKQGTSFGSLFTQKTTPKSLNSADFGTIDYTSKNSAFVQKLEYQKQEQSMQEKGVQTNDQIYNNQKTLLSAKEAYSESSKFFSLYHKQALSLDQKPQIDQTLPSQAKELKEQLMRDLMVSTYAANDNYYKITA